MEPPNIFNARFEYDEDDPPGFQAGLAEVGKAVGGEELSVRLFEIPPGQSLCPYHYEYTEEWLIVLAGPAAVRTPDGTRPLQPGDVVRFETGPGGAHKVMCNGDSATRVLMFSSAREPAVSVYPDSDKIGVWPGNEADKLMVRRADGNVGYYEGETG
jgi:uncharacterized cupin superfamily protein